MIGPPEPQMVADHVVAVDLEGAGCPSDASAADANEKITEHCRVGRVPGGRARRTDLHEHWRVGRARIDKKAGEGHTVHVVHVDRADAAVRYESRQPETEHDRVLSRDVKRCIQVIYAGRDDEALLTRERAVHRRGGGARLHDDELAQGASHAATMNGALARKK